MPLENQLSSPEARRSGIPVWLLCIPCWSLAFYAVAVILIAKLAPDYKHVVITRKFTMLPTILAIASPFTWFFAMGKTRRYRRAGMKDAGTLMVVVVSGMVMAATWVLLFHFRHQ